MRLLIIADEDLKTLEDQWLKLAEKRDNLRASQIANAESELRRTLQQYTNMIEKQRHHMQEWRHGILNGSVEVSLLAARSPARHTALRARCGPECVEEIERQLTLRISDRCWSAHLSNVAEIRRGIHLVRLGGQWPLDEFHKLTREAFTALITQIEDDIVRTFEAIEISADGVDWEQAGLLESSSTWTYLVNDNPFETDLFLAIMRDPGTASVGAMVMGPIFFVWGLWEHWQRRRRRSGD